MQIAQRERIRKGRTVPSENRCLFTHTCLSLSRLS